MTCDDFNSQILSEIKEIPCMDEVNETPGTCKWSQTAKYALEKMNTDCNLTAGLEALLKICLWFDGIQYPYDVERVKNKFMIIKKMYVHLKQFPETNPDTCIL